MVNGSQFEFHLFNEHLQHYGIQHVYTAIYSPQPNAPESVNGSFIAGIRAYFSNNHRQWSQHFHFIEGALRSAYHQTIWVSPYLALFGQEMVNHGGTYDLLRKLDIFEDGEEELIPSYKLKIIRKEMEEHMQKAYKKKLPDV